MNLLPSFGSCVHHITAAFRFPGIRAQWVLQLPELLCSRVWAAALQGVGTSRADPECATRPCSVPRYTPLSVHFLWSCCETNTYCCCSVLCTVAVDGHLWSLCWTSARPPTTSLCVASFRLALFEWDVCTTLCLSGLLGRPSCTEDWSVAFKTASSCQCFWDFEIHCRSSSDAETS